jgi:hypothetical protein
MDAECELVLGLVKSNPGVTITEEAMCRALGWTPGTVSSVTSWLYSVGYLRWVTAGI